MRLGKTRRGFNMIEVIVASTVIAVVLFASVTTVPNLSRSLGDIDENVISEQDARNMAEFVRARGFNEMRDLCLAAGLSPDPSKDGTLTCSLGLTVDEGVVRWSGADDYVEVDLDVWFWTQDNDGRLVAITTEDKLNAPGGATLAEVILSIPGNLMNSIHTFVAQPDSEDDSNYAIIVVGLVTDEQPLALPGALIEFQSLDDPEFLESVTTDSSGRYTVVIPRGHYNVYANKQYYASVMLNATSIDVSSPYQLDIVLERRITVQGQVTDDLGRPLELISVEYTRQETGEEYASVTNESGFFQTIPARPGMYDVVAHMKWQEYVPKLPTIEIENENIVTVTSYNEDTPNGEYAVVVESLVRPAVIRSDQFATDIKLGWTGSFVLRNQAGDTATVVISDREKTTLADYAAAINAQAGRVAKASVSSGRLVLEAARAGTDGTFVWNNNSDPDYILYSLGVVNASGFSFSKGTTSTTQAEFKVGSTSYTRSKNTGIADVISGVSLDLKNIGQSILRVENTRSSGSQHTVVSCSNCLGSTRHAPTKTVTIPTSGPVEIEWKLSGAGGFLITHTAKASITGPGGFSWSQSVSGNRSNNGKTTRTVEPNQVGTFTLNASISSQVHAEVWIRWDHTVQNINSSNTNVLTAAMVGSPTSATYNIQVTELAGKEVVRSASFNPSTHLRWTGSFVVNGRTVTITNPNATRLSDYAAAINAQAGDRVTAWVSGNYLYIKSNTLGTSVSLSDSGRSLVLLRLGLVRNTGSMSFTTKNSVQTGTNTVIRVNGSRQEHTTINIPNGIPGATLNVLSTGTTHISVTRPTYEANPYEVLEFELNVIGNPANHPLDPFHRHNIKLDRLFIVHGVITDDRGLVVPGAEVVIRHNATGEVKDSSVVATARTNSSGEFYIPEVRGGANLITVSRDGGNNGWITHSQTYNINQHTHHEVNVELIYRSSLEGYIQDNRGDRVANATVRISGGPGGTYTGTTDSNGRYKITGIKPGRYNVQVTKSGYDTYVQNNVNIEFYGTQLNVPGFIRLLDLSGRIVDQFGDGVSGVTVSLSDGPRSYSSVTTNSTGHFTFSQIVPGSYVVSASRSGYQTNSRSVSATSYPTQMGNLTINKLVNVSVRVINHIGEPVNGADVRLIGGSSGDIILTGSNGNYSATNVIAGSYRVRVSHRHYLTHTSNDLMVLGGQLPEIQVFPNETTAPKVGRNSQAQPARYTVDGRQAPETYRNTGLTWGVGSNITYNLDKTGSGRIEIYATGYDERVPIREYMEVGKRIVGSERVWFDEFGNPCEEQLGHCMYWEFVPIYEPVYDWVVVGTETVFVRDGTQASFSGVVSGTWSGDRWDTSGYRDGWWNINVTQLYRPDRAESRSLSRNSSIGYSGLVRVNAHSSVTIHAADTLAQIANKLNSVSGRTYTASVENDGSSGQKLVVQAHGSQTLVFQDVNGYVFEYLGFIQRDYR